MKTTKRKSNPSHGQRKGALKTCSRGHRFYKSSDCPACPICWPGRYKKLKSDFPEKLSAPALRALQRAGITSLAELAKHAEAEVLEFHGMGPRSIPKLRAALKAKGLSFKKR